jgi:hypothetical protein
VRSLLRLLVLLGVLLSSTAVAPMAWADPTTPPPVAPTAVVDTGPANPTTSPSSAPVYSTFTFHADNPAATFQCRITGPGRTNVFGPCPGGVGGTATYTNLKGGTYVFTVRAVLGTVVGPQTADYAWQVLDCSLVSTLCPVFAPDHYSVPAGATFNDPTGNLVAQRRNLTHVIRTINSMPGYKVPTQAACDPKVYPSTIRISLYSATDMAFARSLVAAARRCISVQILMNNHLGPVNTQSIRYLQHYLGPKVSDGTGLRRTFAHRCNFGCRGGGVLHAKFYLFDSALTAPGGQNIAHTVMVGSSNMTSNASGVQWNDLYTVRGDATLHSQYLSMFVRMERDRDQQRTFTFSTGPYQTTFTPLTPNSADPTMAALQSIHCVGAKGGTGIGGRTVVYINMHAWFGVRGYAFANRVRQLYDSGCYVKVLYSFMSLSVYKKLSSAVGPRMSVRRTIFSKHGGINATLYSHFKNISVSGVVGTNHAAYVVWTGSNNFTNDGVKFDEVTMRIASRAAYEQYRAQFLYITKRRTSGVYASFAEPIGGGRAIHAPAGG